MGWIQCPHCGLKHSERETGVCPRCQGDVGAVSDSDSDSDSDSALELADAPYQPPPTARAPVAPRPGPSFSMDQDAELLDPEVTLGARIAGGVLVLNALSFAYAGLALNLPAGGRVSSAIVDLILGAALIFGNRKVIPFCVLRVVVGGALFLVWSLYVGDFVSGALQVLLSGSLLALLIGTPSTFRVGAGAVAGAGYVVATAALLYVGTYIRNPDALLASQEIEVIEGSVSGLAFDYRLRVPSDEWFLRADAVTKRENPVADRWLVRPDRDAHFIVVAEQLGAMDVDIGAYQTAVLQNLESAASRFEVLEQSQLWDHDRHSRRVRASALIQGMSIEYVFGLVVVHDVGYQFIGFASEIEYPAVEADFRSMHESLVIGTP